MALIVQKYGGTSVANLDKIRNVADRVIRAKEGGNNLVVVLSAMAGETDRLIGLANQASESRPDEREYDALIATGEQVTVTLLAPTGPRLVTVRLYVRLLPTMTGSGALVMTRRRSAPVPVQVRKTPD